MCSNKSWGDHLYDKLHIHINSHLFLQDILIHLINHWSIKIVAFHDLPQVLTNKVRLQACSLYLIFGIVEKLDAETITAVQIHLWHTFLIHLGKLATITTIFEVPIPCGERQKSKYSITCFSKSGEIHYPKDATYKEE